MRKALCVYFLVMTDIIFSQNVVRENYQIVCGRDTANHFYLSGSVYEKRGNNIERDFYGASIFIKGTKVGTQAGKEGKYCLDITSVVDTATSFTIICHFITYKNKEITIKKPFEKRATLDFNLEPGPGVDDYPEIILNQK